MREGWERGDERGDGWEAVQGALSQYLVEEKEGEKKGGNGWWRLGGRQTGRENKGVKMWGETEVRGVEGEKERGQTMNSG